MNEQIGLAILVPYFIEWLKSASWFKWVNVNSDKLNKALAALLAVASAVGVKMVFDSDHGVLAISGLQWHTMLALGWNSVLNYFMQKAVYHGAVKKTVALPQG